MVENLAMQIFLLFIAEFSLSLRIIAQIEFKQILISKI